MQVSVVLALYLSVLLKDSFSKPLTTFGRTSTTPKSNEENVETFFEAVENGNIEVARHLITKQIANAVDGDGISALHWVCITAENATEGDDLGLAKLLIENGASVNHRDNKNETPLQISVAKGNLQLVRLFVENGSDDLNTALDLAVADGHQEIINYLRQKLDDCNITLFEAVLKENVESVAKCVKTQNINGLNENGESALHLAATSGNVRIADLLIKNGADVNSLDKDLASPLIRSVEKNKIKMVKLLLNNKSNVDAKDKYGCTALMRSSELGHEEMVKLLIRHNANVNIEDNYSTTAAGWARSRGNYNIADIIRNAELYRNGNDDSDDSDDSSNETDQTELNSQDTEVADVNKRDSELRTPLHLATLRGDANMVDSLLANVNINVNAVDNVGSNALHRAAESGNVVIAEKLIKHGINLNYKDVYGCTPLHRAAEHGNDNVAALLIRNKANLKIRDNYSDTPLGWARASGSESVATLLIRNGARR